MILTHFSEQPFVLDRSRVYKQAAHDAMKPSGLWLSDESWDCCWSNWCEGESFNIEKLAHKSTFRVDTDGVLVLKTPRDVILFTRAYALANPTRVYMNMDWPRLTKEHKGLIITPYQWSLRLKQGVEWYYGWDCASGCIWDLSCLKEVKL